MSRRLQPAAPGERERMGVRSNPASPFIVDPAFPVHGRILPYVLLRFQRVHSDVID
jgi:hypothetical protein